ncbi:dihydrofolate reductase family protein [Nocardiopsis sp. CNR-923]|uniref:dihydrofolate reductase family protein n=1 Tax=Nocardiopsis sp. CNR-923 TaxID=1904965 RepID=UPI000AA0776D|nr:dihydrofolate reductase family protein [Nocardiopsis sp. CNR-923]
MILVGAGTARSEGYRRTPARSAGFRERAAAEGRPVCPVTAVVSGAAQVPPLLAADEPDHGDALLVTCAGAGTDALDRARRVLGPDRVVVVGGDTVDLPAAVDALHARGLSRILCEGGPRLLRDVAAADTLDELCLTVVPLLSAGVQQRVTSGAGVDRTLVPRLVVERDGTLLHRWMRP